MIIARGKKKENCKQAVNRAFLPASATPAPSFCSRSQFSRSLLYKLRIGGWALCNSPTDRQANPQLLCLQMSFSTIACACCISSFCKFRLLTCKYLALFFFALFSACSFYSLFLNVGLTKSLYISSLDLYVNLRTVQLINR